MRRDEPLALVLFSIGLLLEAAAFAPTPPTSPTAPTGSTPSNSTNPHHVECTLQGNKSACVHSGCLWSDHGGCTWCNGATEEECKTSIGCTFNDETFQCSAACETAVHIEQYGVCIPKDWNLTTTLQEFTWFERSCPNHIDEETEVKLETVREMLNGKLHFVNHEHDSTIGHDFTHEEHSKPYNILVIFGTFAVGAFTRYMCLGTQVPYTVVIFLIGVGYGSVGKVKAMEERMKNYEQLAFMDPHLIFFIFLPVLIFESAFAMEIPVFKKVIMQCLLLAGPGLMVASLLTGLVAKSIFTDYEWTLPACLLFGTILSATDPVAVVALLKELGASKLISTMIEGESLFNDGTAIVFFKVLTSSVERGKGGGCEAIWETCVDQCFCDVSCSIPSEAHEILIQFLITSCGGMLVGFLFGVITVFSLERVFNDSLTEVTLTLSSAYITFFVCEGIFEVSGVLGLVVLGCYMSYFNQCISPEVEHMLHKFWEMTVYLTNTCIFALAGMIVAMKAFDNIGGRDLFYLAITYATINVVRLLVLGLFMPILRCFQYKMSVGETALVAWGGLRGAVGLALALVIQADERVVVPNVREKFIFHVAGIVILTLVVNGVTTQHLVKYFKLDDIPDRRKRMMKEKFEELIAFQQEEIIDLGWNDQTATAFYDCNWSLVQSYTDLRSTLPEGFVNPYMKKGDPDPKASAYEVGRHAYYNTFESTIHNQYAKGHLSSAAVRDLHHKVHDYQEKNVDSTHISNSLVPSSCLTTLFVVPKWINSVVSCSNQIGRFLVLLHFSQAFDVSLGFVSCNIAVRDRIRKLVPGTVATQIETHCKKAISESKELVNSITRKLPTVSCSIKTKHAARSIMNQMKHELHVMSHEGRLDDQDLNALDNVLESQMKVLMKKFPKSLNPPQPQEALKDTTWYQYAEPYVQQKLLTAASSAQTLGPNLPLSEGGSAKRSGMYLVVSGIVRVRVGRKMYYYGPGYVCRLQSLLTDNERFDDVLTESPCTLIFFPRELIEELMQYTAFAMELWRTCGKQAARILMGLDPRFDRWTDRQIRKAAEKGTCEIMQDPTEVPFSRQSRQKLEQDNIHILLRGSCFEYEGSTQVLKYPALIPVTFKFATFWGHTVLFEMEGSNTAMTRARKRWGRLRSKIRSICLWSSLRGGDWGILALSKAFGRTPPANVIVPPCEEESHRSLPTLESLAHRSMSNLTRGNGSTSKLVNRGLDPTNGSAAVPSVPIAPVVPSPSPLSPPAVQQQSMATRVDRLKDLEKDTQALRDKVAAAKEQRRRMEMRKKAAQETSQHTPSRGYSSEQHSVTPSRGYNSEQHSVTPSREPHAMQTLVAQKEPSKTKVSPVVAKPVEWDVASATSYASSVAPSHSFDPSMVRPRKQVVPMVKAKTPIASPMKPSGVRSRSSRGSNPSSPTNNSAMNSASSPTRFNLPKAPDFASILDSIHSDDDDERSKIAVRRVKM